jgi:replication-associated recombination protein RarA
MNEIDEFKVIGQRRLLSTLDDLIDNKVFPRFVILVGQSGSGKRHIVKYISKKLGMFNKQLGAFEYIMPLVPNVDTIRAMVNEAYKVAEPTLYVIAYGDTLSPAAKNALLKVTEEPPRNAYFILLLEDLNNTLATIRSRGTVMYMDPYSSVDIDEYYKTYFKVDTDERQIMLELCETPGEVNALHEMDAFALRSFVEKVVDNIATVSGSNSFKIANSIALKETDTDKYDLRLFWKAFMIVCSDRLRSDPMRYASGIKITSKYMQELRITGINKASTFDMWLLDIRKEWF